MPEPTPTISPARGPERVNPANPRLILSTLAILAAAIFLLGCGLEGQPFDNEGEDPVVSGEDISAEEVGSQRRTVLEWWRGLQTRNAKVVAAAYAPDVRDELPKSFEFTVISLVAPSASESSITIDSLERNGKNKTTLFSTIDSPNAVMDGPLALPMEKVGDEWLIANSRFLISLSGAFKLEEALQDSTAPPSEGKKPSKTEEPSGG